MKTFARIAFPVGLLLAVTTSAHAVLLFDSGLTSLTASDPTQGGRISRNNVVSDWSAPKLFPGTINTSIAYHYHVYDVAVTNAPYIEVTFDSPSTLPFAAAYQTSYNSASAATNYLGDAGSSGNYFGTDPRTFQFIAASNSHVEILVNDTSTVNGGLGQQYRVIVQGFTDTQYGEPTPEPATLCALGLGALAMFKRRRKA